MAIKELLILEGLEQVQAQLDKAQKAGEDFLKNVRDSANISEEGLKNFSDGLDGAGKSAVETTTATQGFRDSLHLLAPILRAMGIQLGEFTSFSRAAGVGLVGLGAAIGGAVVVALANLEDGAKKTKGTLEDLFGSKVLGGQAFEALATSAKDLGTTVGALAPGFETLAAAWNRFVQSVRTFKFVAPKPEDLLPSVGGTSTIVGSVKNLSDVYNNFIKILRAGRLDQADATKAADAFFKTLGEGGKLTEQALRALPVGSVKLLAQAFGEGSVDAEQFINQVKIAPKDFDKLLEVLGRFTPQAKAAFEANAIITYKDKFGELLAAITGGAKEINAISFSGITNSFIQALIGMFDEANRKVQLFIDTYRAARALLPGGGLGGPTSPLLPGEQIPLPTPRPPQLPASFVQGVQEGIDKIDQDVTPAVQSLGERWSQELFGILPSDAAKAADETKVELQGIVDQPLNLSAFQQNWQTQADQIKQIYQNLRDQIQAIFSNPITVSWDNSNPFLSGQPTNLAGGGYVRGPGTTTSDSIWARLSDKEFVLNAKATQFYGAELLYALNALRVPRQFPGFSMGGLVNAMANAMPKFASGGMATAGVPVTIVIDSQRFNMTAPADTVKALSRFSVNRQLSATGRKPSWVK